MIKKGRDLTMWDTNRICRKSIRCNECPLTKVCGPCTPEELKRFEEEEIEVPD